MLVSWVLEDPLRLLAGLFFQNGEADLLLSPSVKTLQKAFKRF